MKYFVSEFIRIIEWCIHSAKIPLENNLNYSFSKKLYIGFMFFFVALYYNLFESIFHLHLLSLMIVILKIRIPPYFRHNLFNFTMNNILKNTVTQYKMIQTDTFKNINVCSKNHIIIWKNVMIMEWWTKVTVDKMKNFPFQMKLLVQIFFSY